MADTFAKKELEKKKAKARLEKEEKKQQRKLNNNKGKGLEDMMAYVDEYGNLSSTPPDLSNKVEINPADIVLGAAPLDKEHDTLRTGFVAFFDETKGFGFITDSISKENIFVHNSNSNQPLKKGNKVRFEKQSGPKGFVAIQVEVVRQ
ncbi:MAG TPA: cold shock domain-containing protein [Chitinophagaceae bacterium]|nr:cold shock domain-containing protein [Chitinophagaceae bacterium]